MPFDGFLVSDPTNSLNQSATHTFTGSTVSDATGDPLLVPGTHVFSGQPSLEYDKLSVLVHVFSGDIEDMTFDPMMGSGTRTFRGTPDPTPSPIIPQRRQRLG